MGKKIRLTEDELTNFIERIVEEENKEGLMKKIMRKLKGVSDEQVKYNMENGLPWDWNGTKEGFYDKMEKRRDYKGSN